MASRYSRAAIRRTPDVVELSDSDDVYSVSDDEPVQQNFNDRRLTQAINYLQAEGGDDSPATIVERVSRIDNALIKQLPRQGRAFDQRLYRRARAMVLDAQRNFQDVTEEHLNTIESDEEDLPDYDTPGAADEALYRGGDSPSPTPTPAPRFASVNTGAPASQRPVKVNELEHEFKYGGPNNEIENWHKHFPASLPFPETLMMAHWESLKIDFDLARGHDTTIVETNVPFDHEQLRPYMNLAQYESGSRFKLPNVSNEVQNFVSRIGTLKSVVNQFNEPDRSENLAKDYAPRVALEKYVLEYQGKTLF